MGVYYHYTNYGGFEGIVSSKSIWLTQVNRTDDPLEATITREEFLSILDQFSLRYSCIEIIKDMVNDEMINHFNDHVRNSQYAFSLTRLRDSRDHWEKYGDNGKGICIGFDIDKMKPLLRAGYTLNWDIIKVVQVGYDINMFNEIVQNGLNFIQQHIDKINPLLIQLLHRDIAIGKKSLSYSHYAETRLSFSQNNIAAARRTIAYIYEMAGITKPTMMDVDLANYLSDTGIEEELFNEERGCYYRSLNYSSVIPRGIISEVIVGKNCSYQTDAIEKFLDDNGIRCAVSESREPFDQ